mmetsp:Transcript_11197/g.31757  ORF Transcript_11197/g.31757 Transcript_11197/m.31757 type:complete len:182 (-) Transcript_11197:1229-1774(-)
MCHSCIVLCRQLGKHPELTAGVPEVKLVGNMHGDETAACETLLRLAWDLCRRYANPSKVQRPACHNGWAGLAWALELALESAVPCSPPQDSLNIAELLDTTNVYILPTMNPDAYDSTPRVRSNANGFDLNRAFPRFGPTGNGQVLGGTLQPEVNEPWHAFLTSISLNIQSWARHGGAGMWQ